MFRQIGLMALGTLLAASPAMAEDDAKDDAETSEKPTAKKLVKPTAKKADPEAAEKAAAEKAAAEKAAAEKAAEEAAAAKAAEDAAAATAAEDAAAAQAVAPTPAAAPPPHQLPKLGPAPLTLEPVQGLELTFVGRVQVRATLFDGDDPNSNDPIVYGDPGLREGVSIRRARFGIQGLIKSQLHVGVVGGWDNRYDAIHPREAGFRLVSAYVGWQPLRPIGVWAGVLRVPFGREGTASSSTFLMIERSMAGSHMASNWEPGILFGGEAGPMMDPVLPHSAFHWSFGLFNGTPDWTGDADPQPRLAGRVRLDLGDDWDDDESGWELPELVAVSVGGSASYNRGLDANTLSLGADVGVRVWRFSLAGELMFATAEPAFDTEGYPELQAARESLGWYGKVGVAVVPDYLEVAFRADGYNDNRAVEDAGDRVDLSVGVNSNLFDGRVRVQLFFVHRMELSDGHNTPNDSVILQIQGRI